MKIRNYDKAPYVLLSLAVLGMICFAGCGNETDAPSDQQQEKSELQITVKTEPTPKISATQEKEIAQEKKSELDSGLVSEDVDMQEIQAAVAYITLDELKNEISLRHNKPLFLNFWATWCPPCLEEMPRIVELYKKYKNQVDFLAVSCDYFSDSTDLVPDAITLHKMALKTRVLKADDQMKAISSIDEKWEGALPATYIYDTKGKRVESFVGGQSKETFEAAIQNALKSVVKVKLD